MSDGIWIQPEHSNYGGIGFDWPGISITAGVRFPVYCGRMVLHSGWQSIPNYVPGSQVYVIINSTGSMIPDFTGGPWQLSGTLGAEVSGGNIRSIPAPGSVDDSTGVDVFCLYPASNSNYGIQIYDSSNLLEISNVSQGLRPIYKWEGNVTGPWLYPNIPGYDTNKMIAFIHWNDPNVAFTLNPFVENGPTVYNNGLACVQANVTGKYGGIQKAATAWARIVLFHPGGPVNPSTGCGIQIFNSSGQLTWSSATTPFILRGTVGHNFNWEGISLYSGLSVSQPMIPMTIPGFRWGGPNDYMCSYGMKSNGREFTLTQVTSNYSTTGPGAVTSLSNMRLPVIDALDYF